ncbi:phage minor head protein [Psychrobacillus sp. FSL K6-4615]|uniref:phage minor head protein n=1 Tax=Psychrobacillus sp. FSL K6-4615 TaxID=2921551 RepID=UPI0030FCB835
MDLEKYSEKLEKWADKELSKIEGSIRLFYRKLVNTALSELGKIYADYEEDGVLTYASLIKYDRLKKFIDSLTEHVDTMSVATRETINNHLAESYVYSYSWMGWAIESEARKNLQYGTLKAEQIKSAIDNPVKGLTLSQTLERNRRDIIYKIQQEVTQSLVRGSTYKEMATTLKDTFDGDYKKAIRVTRTETHRVREQGTLDSTKRANSKGVIMMKKWRNMKDRRVRKTSKANHVKMDHVKIPVDDLFDLGNGEQGTAPGNTGYAHHDINCRCILVYEIDSIKGQTNEELAQQTFESFREAMNG